LALQGHFGKPQAYCSQMAAILITKIMFGVTTSHLFQRHDRLFLACFCYQLSFQTREFNQNSMIWSPLVTIEALHQDHLQNRGNVDKGKTHVPK
jgi:hypothetical protein